jgi:hypothetical protein
MECKLRLGNRSLRCSRLLFPAQFYLPHPWGRTSCITHRDVGSAIAPCNLAAFPPSMEVNAEK